MKTLTLKIDEKMLRETEEICNTTETSVEEHIHAALCCYNKLRQKEIEQNIHKEKSKCVLENSLKMLKEMEDIAISDCCKK
jgi:hypothetical protein